MAPPSPLVIATKAVERLVKEQASYRRELAEQRASIARLEAEIAAGKEVEDGNGEFILKQQRQAVGETKAVFGPLRKRLAAAVETLQARVDESGEGADGGAELDAARAALGKGGDGLKEGEEEEQ